MNNVLVGLGVLIVAVLGALFAIPQFVDWNSYRGVIEEEASRMAGRDVRIGGGIKLSLLPVPSISIQKLRIADATTGSGEPLFRADSVDAKLSIAPLLRGVLEANEIELVKPVLQIVLDNDGRGNWRDFSLGRGTLPFAPSDVALQSVKITEGTVSLLDRNGARERLTLDHLAGQLSAPALKGPYRFRGQFGAEAQRRDLQFTTVPPDPGSAVKFKAVLKDIASGASATLDGRLQADDGQPQLTGELTGLLPRPGQANQPAKAGAGPAVPMADLKAEVLGDSTQLALKNLSIAFDSAGRPEVLAGSAQFSWDGELKTEAKLTTPWIDLDNVLGNPQGGNPVLALAAFAQRINSLVPGKGTMTTRLEIDQASLGHDSVSGVLIDARSTAGLLALEQVRATLPGGSQIEIQGSIAGQDTTTTFDGDMTLRGTSLARFANWATGGGVSIAPANDQTFQMRGRVTIEPSRSGLSGIVATLGDSALDGSIDYSWQDQRVLRIAVNGARIDARAVAPEQTNFGALTRFAANRLPSASGAAAGDNGASPLVQFNLNAAELVLPDQTLRDVSVKLDRSSRGLNIERLQFSAAHGVAVNVAGTMPMRGSVAAGDAEGLKSLIGLLDLPATFAADRLPSSLLPMRLAGTLNQLPRSAQGTSQGTAQETAQGAAAAPLSIVADGQLGQIDTKLKIEFAAGMDKWRTAPADVDIVLLAPPDVPLTAMALALLRTASLDALASPTAANAPAAAAPGAVSRLALRASGVPDQGLSTSLRIDSPELTAYLYGTSTIDSTATLHLSGDLALDARDGRNLLAEAGGLRLPSMDPLPLRGQARLDAKGGMIDLASLALVAGGGTQVAGRLRLEPARPVMQLTKPQEKADASLPPRRLTGALDVTSLTLAMLLSIAAPVRDAAADAIAAATAAKDRATLWPQANFDFDRLRDLDMSIAFKSGALILADGIVVSDAVFTLLGRRDTLEIRDLAGTSLGGRITASAQLEHVPAGAALSARIGMAGAQLTSFGSTGTADTLLMLSGSGISPAGLAAALTGGGVVNLGAAEVRAVTPASLQKAVDAALKAAPEKLTAVLRSSLLAEAARPSIGIGPRAINITVEDGNARAEPVLLTTTEGRVVSQVALDLSTFRMSGDWRVETKLQPLPALPDVPGAGNTSEPVAPPAPLPLPAVVERFSLTPASLDPRTKSLRLPPETDALERELAVRKVERDLAELERVRRIDELRAAEARTKEAQEADQTEWKKQTESKPVVRPDATAAPAQAQ